MKHSLIELGSISKEIGWIFCCTSFEDRWYSLANSINEDVVESIYVIERHSLYPAALKGKELLEGRYGTKLQRYPIEGYSPIAFFQCIKDQIIPRIEASEYTSVIDVTTFSHEAVLMLMGFVYEADLNDKVIYAYTQASAYSINTEEDDIWLSNGINNIRSVIGFPGQFHPTQKSHLILLMGFEVERARHLIEEYEPTCLSLGLGSQSFRPEFYEVNKRHYDKICDFVNNISSSYSRVNEFEFSCSDPQATKQQILSLVDQHSDYNTTLCSMNTKMSTLGAGLAALDNPNIKHCYVEPMEYNTEGYSSPGDKVSFFSLSELHTELI